MLNTEDMGRATDRRDKLKLCASIYRPAKLKNPAVLHGKQYEAVARQTFKRKLGVVFKLVVFL
jgi:hypothetical protein